jgi:hypothetical protein
VTEFRTAQVLEFLAEVLHEAERASPRAGGVDVIPVIVDDFARLRPLVAEVFRSAGLPFLIADQFADGLDLRGRGTPPDPALRRLVEAIELDPEGTGTPRRLVVAADDDTLTVRVGTDGPPMNPGDRNQIGLLSALLDPSMRGHRLAALAYDETAMAADAADRVWNLLLDDVPRAPGGLPRTLLVVVSAPELDYDRHCRAGAGARWALLRGAVWWRRRAQSDETSVAVLADGDDPLVVVLGAGASLSSPGMLSGDQLRNKALARQVPDLATRGESVDAQARELFRRLGQDRRLMQADLRGDPSTHEDEFVRTLTLERVLREEVHTLAPGEVSRTLAEFDEIQRGAMADPGAAVVQVRRLLTLRARLVLLTVNFDQLVDDGAVVLSPTDLDPYDTAPPGPADPPTVRLFVTEEDFEAFPAYYSKYCRDGGAVPLVKLHGTVDRPETVRANVDVILPGLGENAAELLRSLLGRAGPGGTATKWTYVGCSMRDPDINAVIATRSFAVGTFERWVAPMADPHVEAFARQVRSPAWKEAGLPTELVERIITQTADTFMTQLARWLLPP